MIAEHETNLGKCIAVIRGYPREYNVTQYDLKADISDPLNRIPVAYQFDQKRPVFPSEMPALIIKLASGLLSRSLSENTPETHHQVVRFAINILNSEEGSSQITFTTVEYDRFHNKPRLEGKELRLAILRFIHLVNEHWPTEDVSVFDLYENLNATKEDIETWGNHLVEAALLKVGSLKASERAGVSTRSYRVNAAKRKEIEEELISFMQPDGKLKVFLSYSHKDKHVAGKVKTELEERGLDVFLAHDDIEVSEEWKERILEELKSCHVFIPILSANFEASDWTDQETGHAFANQKVIVPLNLTCNPYGFIGKYQAKPLDENSVSESCQAIIEALAKKPELASFFNRELVK